MPRETADLASCRRVGRHRHRRHFLILNILQGIGEIGWVLTAVIAVVAAVGWTATRETAASREAAGEIEDEELAGSDPANRDHDGGAGRPCRVCGAEYPAAPEECTWDVNVYSCETGAVVCGWTFGPV